MNKIICKICNREFSRKSSFHSHLSRTHKVNKKDYYNKYYPQESIVIEKNNKLQCQICGKTSSDIRGLNIHITKKHKILINEYNNKYYPKAQITIEKNNKLQCQICGKIYKNYVAIVSHLTSHKISSKDYYFKYFLKSNENICECGREKRYYTLSKPFNYTCSLECGFKKAKKTKFERYGDENYNNQDQSKVTLLERYGVKYSTQTYNMKENSKKTKFERYGDENYFNIDKAKETWLKNLGVEYPLRNKFIKIKVKETCIEKWGGIGFASEELRNKGIETSIERYGVPYAMQDPKISQKSQKYRWKKYELPSGKIINLQGYEPQALDELLLEYNESEIETQRSEVPEIWYFTEDGKQHRYFPDIYVEKDNLIIEVKSLWTYKKYLNINILKEEACRESGYRFQFMII